MKLTLELCKFLNFALKTGTTSTNSGYEDILVLITCVDTLAETKE